MHTDGQFDARDHKQNKVKGKTNVACNNFFVALACMPIASLVFNAFCGFHHTTPSKLYAFI